MGPLAALHEREVVKCLPRNHRGVGAGGDVRRDQDARVAPEGVVGRQRLLCEGVERGGRELAKVQRAQQVGFDVFLAS